MEHVEELLGPVGESVSHEYSTEEEEQAEAREQLLALLVNGPWVLVMPSIVEKDGRPGLKVMVESNAPDNNPAFVAAILEAALTGQKNLVEELLATEKDSEESVIEYRC